MPRLTTSDVTPILGSWALPPGAVVTRLEGGYQNDVFRVATEAGTFVLRVCVPETSGASVAWEHRLLAALDGGRTPRAIPTRHGASAVEFEHASSPRVCWLTRYLEGSPLSATSAADRLAAARALGELHRDLRRIEVEPRPDRPALADLDWRENPWWSWERRGELDVGDARLERLDRAIEVARRDLARLGEHGWRRQPLHGDFYAGNLRILDGRVSAIFDWDEARLDWRVCDVADALWAFCATDGRDALDQASATPFLASYEAAAGAPVNADERREIAALVRVRRTWEALNGIGEAQHGHHLDLDYLDANIKAIEALS